MIRLLNIVLLGLFSVLMSACVATYKAAEDGVAGYRDLRVDERTYYVEYTEAASVEWEQVRSFALKRAAELAFEKGYVAFDVISKDEKTVFLKSDVDQVTISTMGLTASDPPVTQTIPTDTRVEGHRVTLKIRLVNE